MKATFIILSVFALFSLTRALDAATTTQLVNLHNALRAEVGLAGLTWSDSLSTSAQAWSDHLASTNTFQHSGTAGVGENIAEASFQNNYVAVLFGLWAAEKQYFIPNQPFPDCTTGGDVGHYTQIMWAKTTQVGCGISNSSSMSYLVCQYSPPGNFIGEYVYTSADETQTPTSGSSGASTTSNNSITATPNTGSSGSSIPSTNNSGTSTSTPNTVLIPGSGNINTMPANSTITPNTVLIPGSGNINTMPANSTIIVIPNNNSGNTFGNNTNRTRFRRHY